MVVTKRASKNQLTLMAELEPPSLKQEADPVLNWAEVRHALLAAD